MLFIIFFNQKTAYELRISDWSSDVCSSDLAGGHPDGKTGKCERHHQSRGQGCGRYIKFRPHDDGGLTCKNVPNDSAQAGSEHSQAKGRDGRSEEHTSELQSLMRISYAVFCLKKKNTINKSLHL